MMYNILIVEDSKPILRDIVRLIRENQDAVMIKTAFDGEEALEIAADFELDILFTDIKMPLMDGLTLIEKIKQEYPSVKCVIISGYTDFSFTHEALRLQVDDYVMKPVDEVEFRCLLSRLMTEIDSLRICRLNWMKARNLLASSWKAPISMWSITETFIKMRK